MENDSSKLEDLIQSSLSMVRESAAYICIVGLRYGQVPLCESRNPSGLSITELEFDEATRLERPILVFIMDNDHLIKQSDIEVNAEKKSKLERFREKVKQMKPEAPIHRVYSTFSSLAEFQTRAAQSVGEPSKKLDLTTSGSCTASNSLKVTDSFDQVEAYLAENLDKALTAFSSQPRVWVDPTIAERSETATRPGKEKFYKPDDLIASKESVVLKAPAQFGLTCLGHYLCLKAWRTDNDSRWVYIDCNGIKANRNSLLNAVESNLARTGHKSDQIKCVVVDSWKDSCKESIRILRLVIENFRGVRIVLLQTVDGLSPISPIDDEGVGRSFKVLHLWSLSREQVRKVVSGYLQERAVGDEDAVSLRVVSDIDTLNLHRTPLNCLTVLKASEADFDENPVNRTEVLHRVLFILFNFDAIPAYKSRPDMKDCEHATGYFVELLMKSENYTFSRKQFIQEIENFCLEQIIAIEADTLFDILHKASIIEGSGVTFRFKFTCWVYYFAAHRMHHNSDFADYIFSGMRYSRSPEIIEFYTGIDRRRADAVRVLARDVMAGVEAVQAKCGLPPALNPLSALEWKPSVENLDRMEDELRDGVKSSNLPSIIKDRYADREYNRSTPYCQSVRELLTGHSMQSLMLSISAASRALRNSDYVNPADRASLLSAIFEGWRQVSQVLFVLLPPLVERGHASFDGAGFVLLDDFGDSPAERFHRILQAIPLNVAKWYQDQIYSPKTMPLFYKFLSDEPSALIKHQLMLLLVSKRPREWKDYLVKYIFELSPKSFYLRDIYGKLRAEYEYSFVKADELIDLGYLIKMILTKHVHGVKKPGVKAVGKVSDSVLPSRDDLSEPLR